MLVTFGALAALFVALDGATGVHPQNPLFAATAGRHTAGGATATRSATPTGTAAVIVAPSSTPVDAILRTATARINARVNSGVRATSTPSPLTPATTATTTTTVLPTPNAAATDTAAGAATSTSTLATDTSTPASSTTTTTDATTTMDTITTTEPLTPTGAISATGTVSPSGDTPPHYGALLNYTNNTQFTPAFMQGLDERIIALTNAQRTAHGLASLSEDGQLDIIAASRSQDQIKRQYFDHYDPTGPVDANGRHAAAVVELLARNGVPYTEVGENLIDNTGMALDTTTPRQLVDSWMQHPEHRDNILHRGYTTIGVGMAAKKESDGLHVVFTQVFVR